jgi:hypothetical protein
VAALAVRLRILDLDAENVVPDTEFLKRRKRLEIFNYSSFFVCSDSVRLVQAIEVLDRIVDRGE